ncbi:SDR family oxidoreductase [Methylocapsa sp. S129]|uniref:SDR family oxidoreductase n=1 Tax=Methylocapsa sp. S129 TaxID=1641869 RepID=UPI00131DD6C4|nr:SDR family oxidoreductase [Methylocapsa sp. S129]
MTNAIEHVVIIGGTSGIGLAAAKRLAGEGMKVTIAGRDRDRLAAASAALAGKADARALDASDAAQVREFFGTLGAFDHLVLALGSSRGTGAFATLDLTDVRRGFEEKVWPHLSCAQAALPTIRKDGSITFISAVSAEMAAPGTAGIAAANGALAIVTPILAAELRPLRVNAVSPGVVDTPWWDFLAADRRQAAFAAYAGMSPVGRVGTPDDIAKAIAFLIADSFVTGHVLTCDGGLRLAA